MTTNNTLINNLAPRFQTARYHRQTGQGMTEYAVILGLIAIISIFLVMQFGDNIKALWGDANTELSGAVGHVEDEAGNAGDTGGFGFGG